MPAYTAHLDSFARDNLPPRELWPEFSFDLPELQYPERLNCATELLDRMVERGCADKPVFHTPNQRWTYRELLERANRIARVLSDDLGLVPGNRVLLRAANNPMLVACWFGVLKAGGIAVTTMPLLRARELAVILDKAEIRLALCDERLALELEQARARAPVCERICCFNGSGLPGAGAELEQRMRRTAPEFANLDTASDDVALIATFVDLLDEHREGTCELLGMAVRDDDRGNLHVPSISRYAASVFSAVARQLNARARSSPAATRRSRSASAVRMPSPSCPSGAKIAASPATSRRAASGTATTGVPEAMASTTGSPNPS